MAVRAFKIGIPRHEGPVWFGNDSWKTEFWRVQWDVCKAYYEGEEARICGKRRGQNPYWVNPDLPISSRQLILGISWSKGFNGKSLD